MLFKYEQTEVINFVKKYLKNQEQKNIDISLSGLCYFPAWSESPGHGKIKFWLYGKSYFLKFLYIIFKNMMSIASHSKYSIYKKSYKKNYDKLVLSWCSKINFKPDGSFQDKYLNQNSNDLENSKWILISMDGYIPNNLNENIILVKKDKTFIKYNIFFLLKKFILLLIDTKFSIRKTIHYFSFHSYFAKKISKIVKKEIEESLCNIIVMPYEGQPFHQFTISQVKKNFGKKINVIGYMHSMLPAVPLDFIYRLGAPDLLLVHGESQLEVLHSKLNWPKKNLLLIKSLRFTKENKDILSKKIYLPYIINNKKLLLNYFEDFLKNSTKNSLPKLDIKIHSTMIDSLNHKDFSKKIEKIMENYKSRFSQNQVNENISIFFGVTASIFEALESGVKAVHICADPLFQHFDHKIWPNLKTEKYKSGVYLYNLTKFGNYINFSNENNTLKKTLNNIILEN